MPSTVGTSVQHFGSSGVEGKLHATAELVQVESRSTLVPSRSSSTVASLGESGGACDEAVRIDAKAEGSDGTNESQEVGFQLVFEQESRKVPSLLRAWRTPDPSPTRDGEDLPRCCAPTLRIVRRDSVAEDSDSAERGRTLSRQSDSLLSAPCTARTPSPCPYEAPFPYAHEYPEVSTPREHVFPVPPPPPPPAPGNWLGKDQCMGVPSPAPQAMVAQPFFCIPYWPPVPCVVDEGAPSCDDASVPLAEEAKAISVGSRGHPTECADPCKYFSKGRGCKDGAACNRCHVCPWRRAAGAAREQNAGTTRDSRGRGRTVERR
eukprot:TRINITY_DN6411_c0_g3_i1.p1 TRINITY_DN6411_c0_g3~~TRINITY_DN6411_c0_g3_i1.p1  ORF type:complete len:320 (-),score=47.43 TRINITY_DN6411_c0_g3_i1:184-1143(-)